MPFQLRLLTAMNQTFSIDLYNHHTQRIFSLFLVRPKVAPSRETLVHMTSLLETRLHALLTHTLQEGQEEIETFCQTMFRYVLRTVEEIASFFGEDADVELDANLEHYGPEAMDFLYQCRLQLLLGACLPQSPVFLPSGEALLGQSWKWEFRPLFQEQIDHAEEILRLAHIMV
jgi:hypothetical protein